jgi:RHS repeat-associated protein
MNYNYVADRSRSGGVGAGTANTGQLMDITGTTKDPSGNTLQRNESYNYDQVTRLSQASGFYAQRNYTYDRFGNRTAVSGVASQSVTLQQPGGGVTNNRIASVNGGPSYQYDAAGDVANDGTHGYNYDAESRIVKVDSGSTATYFYDSANRRVKKVGGGFTTYYVWEGSKVIAESSNAPAGTGGTRFYHPDRLSNRMITDGSGVVKGAMDNLPFGEDGGVIGESEKHRFTTYERDSETSSDYAINRQHSNSTGRFARPDPIGGNIVNPQSLNRYAYALNDPVNLYDPLGLVVHFCPPQYSSCATITVRINGIPFSVNVGFRSGEATFLWGQLGILDQGAIARLVESPLPEGFYIFPSFGAFLREGPIAGEAGTKTLKMLNAELRECEKLGAKTFDDYLKKKNVNFGRANQANAVLKGIDAGSDLFELLTSLSSPFGIALSALSLYGVIPSYSDAFNSEDFLSPSQRQILDEAVAAGKNARKLCQKQVRRKYGITR